MYNVFTSIGNTELKFTTKNLIFSTKCPIANVINRDVIVQLSSLKDSRKEFSQFDSHTLY